MIRCLVVDDSPTFRAALRLTLEARPGVAVVGEAADGLEGVRLAVALRPDVVTMDVRMPRLEGIEATREIMRRAPTRVLILSGDRDVGLALRAVDAGAVDVFAKPRGGAPGTFAREVDQLRAAIASVGAAPPRPKDRAAPRPPASAPGDGGTTPLAVGFGASTGGPNALATILAALPSPFPVPLLVVQHLADGFHAGLAAWLSARSRHPVRVAADGEPLCAGVVYLAPQDRHLGAADGLVSLSRADPVDGFRPSATALFRSLARAYGPRAAGVVLTGMGRDGATGLAALRVAGGFTAAQGPASSVVFGMPQVALASGAAAVSLELEEIAPALAALVAQPRAAAAR
jgi:two-component system chemotaxis response regulator CheB